MNIDRPELDFNLRLGLASYRLPLGFCPLDRLSSSISSAWHFLSLIQSGERPEQYGRSFTTPRVADDRKNPRACDNIGGKNDRIIEGKVMKKDDDDG
jgi:hypothetical protein